MRTKSDLTIPFIIIGYSILFTIPLLLKSDFKLTTFGLLWIGFWSLVALFGIWKIEYYEIKKSLLIKRNFLGAFTRKWDLQMLNKYSMKNQNTDLPTNPFNIIRIFTKKTKYLKFREIKLEFSTGSGVRIDERTMDSSDFQTFYNQLKNHKRNPKNKNLC